MTDERNGKLETLVGQVKDKCKITWEDETTERVLKEELVPSACSIVRFKIGIPDDVNFDFTEPGIEHRILINYCFYAWHDAEDDFERNYAADIAHARRLWEVRNDARQQEGAA